MLSLANIVSISIANNPSGLGDFNVNNIALFSDEVPVANDSASSSSSSGAGEYVPGPYGEYRVYKSLATVGTDWGTSSETYKQASALFSQQPNILAGGGKLLIFTMGADETLAEAIARTVNSIFYVGIISTAYPTVEADMEALATAVQAYGDKILFLPSNVLSDIAGTFTDIKDASNTNTRCLYYSESALDARLFAAAYAGRAFSTNFEGSNTALTMNLKTLQTIEPDDTITQTIYDNAATAGVDLYVSFAGISAVVSNGANSFFDQVHNVIWFVARLKVAGFNALYLVGSKVPQTEAGISVLKGAYREICERALRNGYVAPGSWNSGEWFGNQEDMINNITERGYYIYSAPVSLQAQADREAREAPLIQIAIKEAGAVHSTGVIVNINA